MKRNENIGFFCGEFAKRCLVPTDKTIPNFLNNKYVYNLVTLDQRFWPDGLYTAPTDEALKFDIEAIKAMGFNIIRKTLRSNLRVGIITPIN